MAVIVVVGWGRVFVVAVRMTGLVRGGVLHDGRRGGRGVGDRGRRRGGPSPFAVGLEQRLHRMGGEQHHQGVAHRADLRRLDGGRQVIGGEGAADRVDFRHRCKPHVVPALAAEHPGEGGAELQHHQGAEHFEGDLPRLDLRNLDPVQSGVMLDRGWRPPGGRRCGVPGPGMGVAVVPRVVDVLLVHQKLFDQESGADAHYVGMVAANLGQGFDQGAPGMAMFSHAVLEGLMGEVDGVRKFRARQRSDAIDNAHGYGLRFRVAELDVNEPRRLTPR